AVFDDLATIGGAGVGMRFFGAGSIGFMPAITDEGQPTGLESTVPRRRQPEAEEEQRRDFPQVAQHGADRRKLAGIVKPPMTTNRKPPPPMHTYGRGIIEIRRKFPGL